MTNKSIDARTLTDRLGGRWHGGYGCAACAVCQPSGRRDQDALTISDGTGGSLLLHCKKSGCDFRDILAAVGLGAGTFTAPDRAAQREAEAHRAAYDLERLKRARAIWVHAGPIEGTAAERYLRGRGITCPLPPSLRFTGDIRHTPSGQRCAAMLADVSTGGVHRTYFDKSGKRLTKSAKMMLGPCAGGHVCLSDGPGALVVAEGLETGLALASGLLSGPATVWAALSTSGMRALNLPDRPGRLTVAADGDAPGHEAGDVLASRAAALGWRVSLLPAPDGRDWCDVLAAKGVAA